MNYDFYQFKKEAIATEEWLRKEFGSINTGRATPAVLDLVQVESYGANVPISHIASIAIEDPRTLSINPWDKTQSKEIEKAILASNLGLSVSVSDTGVRVVFPQPTTERRGQLVRVLKERLEEARVAIRGEREKTWNDIQAKEKTGTLSEDDKFRAKDELQKHVDEANRKLEEVFEKKEKEVMGAE